MKHKNFSEHLTQLHLQLKKRIKNHPELSQFVPPVKVNINEYSPFIGTELLALDKFVICVGLTEACVEMPPNLYAFIKKITDKFVKEKKMKCTFTIFGESVKKLYSVSDAVLIRALMNLKPCHSKFCIVPTYAEFKKGLIDLTRKNWDEIETWDKIHFLQNIIEKAVFSPQFYDLFPGINGNSILASCVLDDMDTKLHEEILAINSKMTKLVDKFAAKINNYADLKLDDNVYTLDFLDIALGIGLKEGPARAWSTYHTFQNFCEDLIDELQILYKLITYKKQQIEILMQINHVVNNIFKGMSEKEGAMLLFNTRIFNIKPIKERLEILARLCETLLFQLNENVKTYESGRSTFNHMTNHFIDYKDFKFAKISPALSTPVLPVNPHAFFAETSISPVSLTHVTKQEAKEKNEREERKKTKKIIKSNNQPLISSSDSNIESKVGENWCTLYINGPGNSEPIASQAFQLAGFKHIFMCCDVSHMNQNDIALINEFLAVVMRGKILSRDSLGQEGMKIYGLNCMYVKSLSKQAAGQRMLCFAHPIANSECFMYRFEKIVTHDVCERLLTDVTKIQSSTRQAQNNVCVSFDSTGSSLNPHLIMKK